MKKKINFKYFVIFFMILCLITAIYSGFSIINWYISNRKNASIKKELEEKIVIKNIQSEEIDNDESNNKNQEYEIDFKALKEKNPDVVGYLKVPNTNIDYFVVKTNDNEYYLKHNFNREWNVSGWIFADYRNKLDGFDKNIIIYGHNTRDGSMFGTLKNILNKDWYTNEQNYEIVFVSETESSVYKVMSVYTIEKEDYYVQTDFVDLNEFEEFVNKLKSRSIYNFNLELNENSQILTLSSCMPGGIDRVVLHAVKIR